MAWQKIAVAPNQVIAESWQELLRSEGIPSTVWQGDVISFIGTSPLACALLVPDTDVEKAKEVLRSVLNDSDTGESQDWTA